jgi:hypothetical protein
VNRPGPSIKFILTFQKRKNKEQGEKQHPRYRLLCSASSDHLSSPKLRAQDG